MKLKHCIATLVCCFTYHFSFAQTDSTKRDSLLFLKELVVTGFQPNNPKYTSLHIEAFSLKNMSEKAPFNLSDALAKMPGIAQIATGNSISKPVIRGLYGNRILVLLSGVRFDNQQWQDEHGLGLSQIGIDRVEVIKGPASLLYGSDALGGVINVIEEKPSAQGQMIDAGTLFFSNSIGNLTDVGFSKRKTNKWWRVRVGAETHADYSDGKGQRVLNSRNSGYYLKAGFGFEKSKWKQENSYNFSYNSYGFILEELNSFFDADERWSRKMNGPHHIVILNLLNSQNTFALKKSLLKLNVGFQSNSRREDEGGGQISLNMHLVSALQNLKWEKNLGKKTAFVLNQQFTFENNTNYGGRIIVPDANLMEGNLSGYFKFHFSKLIVETGLGGNYKSIQTFVTRTLNSPNQKIQPFVKSHLSGNSMLGLVYNPNQQLSLKSNTATGYRSGNLAELSSNGLHEGVYRYELGDPNLKTEQNINTDLSLEMESKHWFISVSGFYNRFINYIYLAPTNEKFYGYQVFRFRQQNASLQGAELISNCKPSFLKYFEWKESFTLTQGKLDHGGNLPFIPAYKIISALRFEKEIGKKMHLLFIEPEFVYVFHQENPAQFETKTGDYYLLNFSSGITLPAKSGNWKIGLVATNLTNVAYADHLSRLKNYGLLNEGINIMVSVRKTFQSIN